MDYQCSASGYVRGGVGPKTTHFSSHKYFVGVYRHDEGFWSYQLHRIAYPMELSWIGYYPFGDYSVYSFGVASVYCKGGFSTSTIQLSTKKIVFFLNGDYYVSSLSSSNPYRSHYKKDRSYYYYYLFLQGCDQSNVAANWRGVIGQNITHFSSHKFYSSSDRHDGDFLHYCIIT